MKIKYKQKNFGENMMEKNAEPNKKKHETIEKSGKTNTSKKLTGKTTISNNQKNEYKTKQQQTKKKKQKKNNKKTIN